MCIRDRYVAAIERMAGLLPDAAITDANESWTSLDDASVTWTQAGTPRAAEVLGKYFDASLVAAMSDGLPADARRLHAVDNLGMPDRIIAATNDDIARLASERGWDLHRPIGATADAPSPKRRWWRR